MMMKATIKKAILCSIVHYPIRGWGHLAQRIVSSFLIFVFFFPCYESRHAEKWRRVAYGVLGKTRACGFQYCYTDRCWGGFCLVFVSWLLFCVFFYPFVGLWLCLFISSAVDCPHVHTLFFRRIEVRFELLSAEADRPT